MADELVVFSDTPSILSEIYWKTQSISINGEDTVSS